MKVLCSCPTYGRLDVLPIAVAGFLRQTHTDKHLVIVNDDEHVQIELDPEYKNENIHIINLKKRTSNIEKRNTACKFLDCDIGMSWDDDDIFLPNRIENHVYWHDAYEDDFFINKSYLMYDNNNGLRFCSTCAIHMGSWKQQAFLDGGGYCGEDQAYDDQYLYNKCFKTRKHIDNKILIDAVYVWGGRNYHLSASDPNHIENFASRQRKELAPEGKFLLTPNFINYQEWLDKVTNKMRESHLHLNYLRSRKL